MSRICVYKGTKEELLNLLCFCAFCFLYFLKHFIKVSNRLPTYGIVLVGLCAYFLVLLQKRLSIKTFGILLLFNMLAIIAMCINKNLSVVYWISDVASQGLSILIVTDKKLHKSFKVFFYILLSWFLLNFMIGKSWANVIYGASQNYISVILLSMFLFLYASNVFDKRIQIVLSWLICFLVVFSTESRAGIIAFLTFILLWFITEDFYKQYKKSIKKLLLLCLLVILVLLGYNIYKEYQTYIEEALSREGRFYLWESYYEKVKINIVNVLFGANNYSNDVFLDWGKNMHNSFIQIHIKYGLMPLLGIFCGLFYKVTHNKIVFVCAVCLFVRGVTDSFILGDVGDFVLYFLLLKPSMNDFKIRQTNNLLKERWNE